MDNQRQQYIPGPPPPPPQQQQQQGTISHLPPPPPRLYGQPQSTIPPPPPGPYPPSLPPGTVYGLPGGWQQSWGRPGMGQGLPPPPPMNHTPIQSQAYGYGSGSQRQPGQLNIPPPPPQYDKPMLSATFIPGGDSFGPGVGIPPFEDYAGTYSGSYSQYDNPYPSQASNQPTETSSRENRSASASSNRPPLSLALRESSPVSPGPPTATLRNPQPPTSHPENYAPASSQRQRAQSAALGVASNDLASQWPSARVGVWLAANGFTVDWQETFKALNIQGAEFLQLGQGGRGFSSRMYQVVYPKLAQVCSGSSTGWDQSREREEGKRLRRLIARLADGSEGPMSAGPGHRRRESALIASASTDGNVENSPHLGSAQFGKPPTTPGGDDSPAQQMPPQSLGNFGPRGSQGRSSTLPTFSKQSAATSTPSEGRHAESYSSRSDYRGVLNGLNGRGRHSPGPSGDSSQGLGLHPIEASPNNSPNPSHAVPTPVSAAPNTSSGRNDHSKSNSIDSSKNYTGRTTPSANVSAETGPSGRFYESRRNVDEQSRPTALESQRTYSNDGSKEHRQGFFSKLRLGNKKHDLHHDEQPLESPTSPSSFRMLPALPFQNRADDISDPALSARPLSSHELGPKNRKTVPEQRKFVFVTPDKWNYRLIDVTDVESALALRSIICIELGVPDADRAQVFVTEAGQSDHDEPLSDSMLVAARSQADTLGSLKLYVHQSSSLSPVSGAQTNGYGMSLSSKPSTNLGLHSEPMLKSNSAGGIIRKPSSRAPEFATAEALQKAAEDWRRETEKKQQAYLESRKDRKSVTLESMASIRAPRVIDFDTPRLSPYEDKKMETLVPMRKPPAAPAVSNTLTKVNSLRRPGERNRGSMDALKMISEPIVEEVDRGRKRASGELTAAGGIGAALAALGRLAGAPATAGAGQSQGPTYANKGRSCDTNFTWSKGNMLFKIPVYDVTFTNRSQADNDTARVPIFTNQTRPRESSPSSPASDLFARPLLPRVKSYGPDLEFKETNIAFTTSPRPQATEDSDDDSDDGLFAIPIANKSTTTDSRTDATNKDQRPTLTVNTEQKTRRSVAFLSPNSASVQSAALTGDASTAASDMSNFNHNFSDDSAGYSGSAISPADRRVRPDSFVSDIWANRPAIENVVDHLDRFFPGVDLDEPYLEESGDIASPAPLLDRAHLEAGPSSLRDRMAVTPESLAMDLARRRNESDTLGSDESTLKESNKDKIVNVASRQMSKSGGLGRMKSIREVARKRNHEVVRGPSTVVRTPTHKESNLQRRKSTKMFGAHIVQIQGGSGTRRISTLDPIPQEEIPNEDTPKRQATFKIIRGELIGKGTYGRVYLGMNATTGDLLAVKQVEINQKAAGQDRDRIKEMVAALDLEIDTMQHLEHPNIVQYLGCERREFSISIYLEYIPGGSVGSCLRKHGKFEEPVVKSLTHQTLIGLAYLHQESILHRDLKADNILLDLDGTCKISDFGISKKSDNIYGDDKTNSMQGSVFWMAPEVVRAKGTGYSAKVDIWSLGCVVLEMFAGKRPWSRDEAIGAIYKLGKLNQAPPIPEDVATTASVEGLNFMYDCFQINPKDRPTAETLLRHSTFCIPDRFYNFYDTNLAAKLRTSEVTPSGI